MTDEKARVGNVAVDPFQEPRQVSLAEHQVQGSMPRLAFDRDHYSQVI